MNELFPTVWWAHDDGEECEPGDEPCQQRYHQLRRIGSTTTRRTEDGSEDADAKDALTAEGFTTDSG